MNKIAGLQPDVTHIDMRSVARLVESAIGTRDNCIIVSRTLLELLDGDFPAAVVLGQCVYWQGKVKEGKCGTEDGYFWISQADWQQQTGLSEYQVRTATKKLKRLNLVEAEIRKAWSPEAREKVRRVHYKANTVNLSKLLLSLISKESIPQKLQNPFLKNSRIPTQETIDGSHFTSPTKITTKDYPRSCKSNASPNLQNDQREAKKIMLEERARWIMDNLAATHYCFLDLQEIEEQGLMEGIKQGLQAGLAEGDLLALGHYSSRSGVDDPINYFLRGVKGAYGKDPILWAAKHVSREKKKIEKERIMDRMAQRFGLPRDFFDSPN